MWRHDFLDFFSAPTPPRAGTLTIVLNSSGKTGQYDKKQNKKEFSGAVTHFGSSFRN